MKKILAGKIFWRKKIQIFFNENFVFLKYNGIFDMLDSNYNNRCETDILTFFQKLKKRLYLLSYAIKSVSRFQCSTVPKNWNTNI